MKLSKFSFTSKEDLFPYEKFCTKKKTGKKEFKKLTLAENMVMDVSATTVAFLSKDKNANV